MGTRSVNVDGKVAVAAGPQAVTVSWKEGVGEWSISEGSHTTNHGHWFGQVREPVNLVAGQTLEVDGVGLLVATATTFTTAFDALNDAT